MSWRSFVAETLFFRDPVAVSQHGMLRWVRVAHTHRLDLPTLVEHSAQENRGWVKRRMRRFAERLRSGLQLPDALEQTPGVLSPDQTLAVRFGCQTGTLTQVLDQAIESDRPAVDCGTQEILRLFRYALLMLLIVVFLSAFLSFFIFPTLIHLGEEFTEERSNLGRVTESFDRILDGLRFFSRTMESWWLVLVLIPVGLFFIDLGLRGSVADLGQAWFRRTRRDLLRARLLELIATTLEAGRPLPSAISTLAKYHFDARFRSQLLLARNEIEQGVDWWQGLQASGVVTRDQASALARLEQPSSQAWLLRRFADSSRIKARRSRAVWISLLGAAVTLFFAATVFWICSMMIGWLAQFVNVTGG